MDLSDQCIYTGNKHTSRTRRAKEYTSEHGVVPAGDDACEFIPGPSTTQNNSGAIYGAVPTFDVVKPRQLTTLEMPKSHIHGTPCLSTKTFC
jgi:hypothetical protein